MGCPSVGRAVRFSHGWTNVLQLLAGVFNGDRLWSILVWELYLVARRYVPFFFRRVRLPWTMDALR